MGSFDHLMRCGDMTTADLTAACVSRDAFAELLKRLEDVSSPNTGAASILIVLAALASNACEWIDGDLAIELLDADECTNVAVMLELGAGMRERMFPPLRLFAPLSELTAALSVKPDLIGALTVHRRSWKRLTFGVSERIRQSSLPPRISDESLIAVRTRTVSKVPVKRPSANDEANLDSAWDDLDEPGG